MPLRCASFTSAGTSSWVVPDQVTGIWVNAIGGGGGGAGGNSLPSHSAAGGGSGGWCLKVLMTVVPGETLTVTVGTGGVGGIANVTNGASGAGGTGGDSSVVGSAGTVKVSGGNGASGIISTGGSETSHPGKGGNGHLGGTGNGFNEPGQQGGFFGLKHGYMGGGSGGGVSADGGVSIMNGYGTNRIAITQAGGGGSPSIYGVGGAPLGPGIPPTAGNPAPTNSYGAGGGGPYGSGLLGSIAKNGGAGAKGRIDIFWIGA